MQVKFKKLVETAVIPKYAKEGDAAMDLTAVSFKIDEFGNYVYGTGLSWEIEKGFVGLLFARSSVVKQDLLKANGVGVIDSGYRGEIMVVFKKSEINPANIYKIGDRVAQFMIIQLPKIEVVEAESLGESDRGEGGFGSTGQ